MVIDESTAQRFIAAYMHFLSSLLQPQETKGLTVMQLLHKGRARLWPTALLTRYRQKHPKADAEMLDAIAQSQFGRWVCDGLNQEPVWLGSGYKRSYTESYTALRKAGGFSLGPG